MTAEDNTPVEGKETETCCKLFSPDCGHIDATNTYIIDDQNGYHIYDCPAGTTFNTDNMNRPTVTAAVCCKYFSPTCRWNSGSILGSRPFVCPSGKTFNDKNENKPANKTTCYMVFTPKCSLFTAAGAIFKCPTGKTQTSDFDDKEGTPNEATCCTVSTSGSVRQSTCADFHAEEDFCHASQKQRDANKDADVTISDRKLVTCCKFGVRPSSGTRFIPIAPLTTALLLL
jgi:hypothetical protein